MAMTVDLPALEQTAAPRAAPARWSRLARPALGLLVPVVLALGWELVVYLGYSNGRLVPPPSKVFETIVELAKSGELSRHILATLWRVGAGFALGVVAGTIMGA
ncbi:MAG: ABC transporter permease, partial [Bradyrhizobium sp.]